MSGNSLSFNVVELLTAVTAEEDDNVAVLLKGPQGAKGATGTIAVGTITTLAAGSKATVSNVGTNEAAIFDFGLPQGALGATGPKGATGATATIAIGTITTLAAGSKATVANAGTNEAAIFNFGIPKGDTGSALNATATDISNIPAGNITGVTVQAAVNELDTSITNVKKSLANYLPLAGGTLTGALGTTTITTTAPAARDNTTKVPNTAWLWGNIQSLVQNCIAAVATAAGFGILLNANGYFQFLSWLGGCVIQWGYDGSSGTYTFPLVFKTTCFQVVGCLYGGDGGKCSKNRMTPTSISTKGFTIPYAGCGYRYIAIGY